MNTETRQTAGCEIAIGDEIIGWEDVPGVDEEGGVVTRIYSSDLDGLCVEWVRPDGGLSADTLAAIVEGVAEGSVRIVPAAR